ncbi:hypothetical protein C1646_673483 [Rhizophagus diaphanus]|nr:hypothetical protein C1646_673483 [Rhizophagus diaphanus] [Rhizophagus sp. MUCL 43196]
MGNLMVRSYGLKRLKYQVRQNRQICTTSGPITSEYEKLLSQENEELRILKQEMEKKIEDLLDSQDQDKSQVTKVTDIKVVTFSASTALQEKNVDVPVVPPDIEEKQDVVEIPPSDDKEMIKALHKKIEELNKEIKVLRNKKVEDQQKILELQQEIVELKKQIKHLEKNNERLEKNNKCLEEQIINLQKNFKDFKIKQLILSEYRDWIHGFIIVLVKKFSDLENYEDLKDIH